MFTHPERRVLWNRWLLGPTLFACLALVPACSPGTPPQDALDGGANSDAGTTPDSGLPVDGGSPIDAGPASDGGPGRSDAGSGDAGMTVDAGEAADAGTKRDAGTATDGGDCDGGCMFSRLCCDGQCVNPANDPFNCGTCGTECTGADSFCTNNMCQAPSCTSSGTSCAADGGMCCGANCCGAGQLCCDPEGPVSGSGDGQCFTPTADNPTCPQGCAPLCVSDRDAKRDVVPVDDRAVLDALAHLPISTWSYKDGDASVRHLGPMAQDFRAAFNVGATEKGYDPVDAHGVAFSSIRALYSMVRDQNERLAKLEQENAELRKRLGERGKSR